MNINLTAIDALREKLTDAEFERVEALRAGEVAAMQAHKANPTPAALRHWQEASKALAAMLAALGVKDGGDGNEAAAVIGNIADLARWLADEGYCAAGREVPIKKSKVYADAKKGAIRAADPGAITVDEAMAYVARAGLQKSQARRDSSIEDLSVRKMRAELLKTEEQTREIVLNREIKAGKYILRDEAIAQRVDQLAVIETHFRQLLHTRMLTWCYVLAGKPDKVPEAVRQADIDMDGLLNALARSESFAIEYEVENG